MLGISLGRSYKETHIWILGKRSEDGICRFIVKQTRSSIYLIMHPIVPTMGNVWRGDTVVVLSIYGHQCQHRPSICVWWIVCVMSVLSECKCTTCMWCSEARKAHQMPWNWSFILYPLGARAHIQGLLQEQQVHLAFELPITVILTLIYWVWNQPRHTLVGRSLGYFCKGLIERGRPSPGLEAPSTLAVLRLSQLL